jgi:hypothetical protein
MNVGHMTKVATELPISCRPGWTPDYELIAARIPTLVLPSNAILSVGVTSFLSYPH